MKDMPTEFPNGLGINTFLKREDFRDSFVSLKYNSINELPKEQLLDRLVLGVRLNC